MVAATVEESVVRQSGGSGTFARTALEEAARNGQTVMLTMDQTDLGDRFAVLMVALQVGDRSLPLAWKVEAGAANIGFAGQQVLLEQVRAWLPPDTAVLLLGDRFYPSADLFTWLHQHGWQYRLRLKGNLTVDTGFGETTTGELANGVSERYLPDVRLFHSGVPTNLGILHEAGHEEPWIIAMDCQQTQAAVRDYGTRWVIEQTFSDFKSRGFQLEDTQLQAPDRLARLILIMTLAMYWCVQVGRHDEIYHPTPLEKKAQAQTDSNHWSVKKVWRSLLSWFKRGLRLLKRQLQTDQLLPAFIGQVMRN